ncbi:MULTISPECIES: PLP-dependent aminotransferase family protein [unclassified Crossiella]|uniref:aminotransferase-like domain-containing protein n=1 Tax=unclassified Crossiella TaxID=2620835 RepID=UPI001FFFF359|nr:MULTISPECIES: PLP-dependent aminotransferase family protein [unclassified Crossiella]MCK2242362.1 PLP-dependent aminotransferase family protein [Crossiella sp. S99.2]MCK2254607.1 PLP-dependent aminotransferase family protein [Crossiella sp. S99.1]
MPTVPIPGEYERPLTVLDAALPAELPIVLDRGNGTPLAVQLADALRRAAATGQLRHGDRLPSTRALAGRLQVSRTVTAAAYEQLHAEGWIGGRRGSGTYVTTTPPAVTPSAGPARRAESEDTGLIDLVPGASLAGGVDRAAWRRAWRAAGDVPAMPRPERAGLTAYREIIAEHLLRHRGLVVGAGATPAEAVLATLGTSAAVTELAGALFQPGDTVAIEEPGYQRAVGALRAAGMRVIPAEIDADGLVVDALPSGIRAVYCSPAHQYPLGGRLPAARRVELVRRARAEGWLVIEDDYDGELRYDVAPLPLLAALAPDVVVHLGTTSKILSASLGVGWMVAPPEVARAVLDYRHRCGVSPAAAGQQVMVQLARNGDLGRHLRRLRRELAERRELVVSALSVAGAPVFGDSAGGHVVVLLDSLDTERAVIAAARARGLSVDGLARHHQATPRWHGLAVGYTNCTRAQLTTALPTLVNLLTP